MTEIKRTMIASLLIERATEMKGKRPSELGFEDLVDVVQAVVKNCSIPVVSTRIFRRGDKVEWRGMKLIVVEVGVGEVLIATSENVDDEEYNDWWVHNEYVC